MPKKKKGSDDEESEKKTYEINSLDDYFSVVREVFLEFKKFIKDTNDILNLALGAIRDIMPMIMAGNIDYEKVFKIVESINTALKSYIKKQSNFIDRMTAASEVLSKDIDWEKLIIDFLTSRSGEEESKPDMLPARSLKGREDEIIEEKFGVKPIGKEEEEEEDF